MITKVITSHFLKIVFIISTFSGVSFGQDNHYWSQQFGARSSLLGGAVVGGVRDNSAIYYNPGAAAFIEQPTISVNANAYKYESIQIKNGAGDGIDLHSNRLSLFPQLISGLRSFKKDHRIKWGFVLLTRNQSNIRIHERKEMFYDVIGNLTGNEEFIGTYDYENTLSELWGGLNLSFKVSKHFAIGLTQFVSYRNQIFSIQSVRNVIPASSNTATYFSASASDLSSVSYSNLKALWKLGIAFDFNHWRFGLTVTSPSVQIYGSGTVNREIISNDVGRYYNAVATNTVKIPNYTASAEQKLDNKVEYRSPLSIAVGIEYHFPKTRLYFTGEFFSSIGSYKVANPDLAPFVRPSTVELTNTKIPKSTEFLAVTTLARTIFNFAGGVEHDFNDNISIHLGFRTDFDSFDREKGDERTIPLAATYWDLYHASGGFSFHKNNDIITIGASYAFSGTKSKANEQYINYSDPKDYRYFLGNPDYSATTSVSSINLIIGYTRFLKPKESKTH